MKLLKRPKTRYIHNGKKLKKHIFVTKNGIESTSSDAKMRQHILDITRNRKSRNSYEWSVIKGDF